MDNYWFTYAKVLSSKDWESPHDGRIITWHLSISFMLLSVYPLPNLLQDVQRFFMPRELQTQDYLSSGKPKSNNSNLSLSIKRDFAA